MICVETKAICTSVPCKSCPAYPKELKPETAEFLRERSNWLASTRWQNSSILVPRVLWTDTLTFANQMEARHDQLLVELSEWVDALRMILSKAKARIEKEKQT